MSATSTYAFGEKLALKTKLRKTEGPMGCKETNTLIALERRVFATRILPDSSTSQHGLVTTVG